MGKQGKSKANKGASTVRPSPYGKKPKVEVKFEGNTPSTSSANTGTTSNKQTKSEKDIKNDVKSNISSSEKAVPTPEGKTKDKGKSKAPAPSPVPVPVKQEAQSENESEGESSRSNKTFIVIAGTYEKNLYGIEGSFKSDEPNTAYLEPVFIFPAHLACIKAVAASKGGKWLATGSEDEFVKVWDLRRRKEVGSLSQHTGSITSLHFPTSSHLITTSEDSTLSLFRTSDWALLKSLKGHSGRVNHVDVHPTGRVALSVGKDNTLKMWDLMRGRGAASLPLGSEAEMVKFSQSGTHFAVLFPRKIEIYSLTLKLLHTLETGSRFNTLLFATLPKTWELDDAVELLCVGTEKGIVEVYTIEFSAEEADPEDEEDEEEEDEQAKDGDQKDGDEKKGKGMKVERVGTLVGHTNRIKSISALPFVVPEIDFEERPTILLSTVSSDGLINIHDLFLVQNSDTSQGEGAENTVEPIGSYDTKGSRLTCVYLADGQDLSKAQKVQKKKESGSDSKQVIDEGSEDEDEEDGEDDMYESGEDGEDDEMAVEFEDEEEEEGEEEEEEEEEEEGEYEED